MMVKVSAFPSFNQPMQPSLTQENIKIAAKESIRVTSLTGYNTQPPVNHRSSGKTRTRTEPAEIVPIHLDRSTQAIIGQLGSHCERGIDRGA